MVDVFTETLQHPVVISDGRSLIFTRSEVALQLSASTGFIFLFFLERNAGLLMQVVKFFTE